MLKKNYCFLLLKNKSYELVLEEKDFKENL